MKTIEEVTVVSDQDRRLLHEVKRTIRESLPTAEVLLYGSVARGTQEPESDYDILVLTDDALSREEERAVDNAIYELELAHGVVLSTIYHSIEEWNRHPAMPFHVRVESEGIVL